MAIRITFLGAAGTVTGSKYLVDNGGRKIMVDCGLFQGLKELRERNWEDPPVSPREVSAIYLTHGHIDHSGYLPLFVRNGYQGPIYCSVPTQALCKILLPDAAHIQEEDANRANRYGYTKHHPALPLYTEADADAALRQMKTLDYGIDYPVGDDWSVHLSHSGHILGSAFLNFRSNNTSLLFTGDLGRPNDLVMRPPAHIQSADYLVLDSTYGDRKHSATDPVEELAEIIRRTAKRDGTVLIPAFAVGRTQTVLYILDRLRQERRIPNIDIYLDSPMAQDASDMICRFPNEHKLTDTVCHRMCDGVQYTRSVAESKALNEVIGPKILLSASGMLEGGRVLHHLVRYAPERKNTIVFTGFQAPGTRGERILRGEPEIKMLGTVITVRAEVCQLENMSSHADYDETIQWLKGFRKAPAKVFLTHGQPEAAAHLKKVIEEELGWEALVVQDRQTVEL